MAPPRASRLRAGSPPGRGFVFEAWGQTKAERPLTEAEERQNNELQRRLFWALGSGEPESRGFLKRGLLIQQVSARVPMTQRCHPCWSAQGDREALGR